MAPLAPDETPLLSVGADEEIVCNSDTLWESVKNYHMHLAKSIVKRVQQGSLEGIGNFTHTTLTSEEAFAITKILRDEFNLFVDVVEWTPRIPCTSIKWPRWGIRLFGNNEDLAAYERRLVKITLFTVDIDNK